MSNSKTLADLIAGGVQAVQPTLYQLMADIQEGTATIPATVDEVMALLPTPTWPV